MSVKTKAQLLAEIEALYKRFDELQAVKDEPVQKSDIFKKQAHTLGERVKKLTCLYGISNLAETPGISLTDILQGCVELLPPAGQYPQITCARITLKDREYKNKNFRETKWKLAGEIKVEGKRAGVVEVFYLEEQPKENEGPFLNEEQALIDAVAERLGRIIQRVGAQERVEHLTLVLRAIRNVNQLIIHEKNRDVLIHEICDNLIETRGYSTAWIMLLDERCKYLDSAESGLGKSFIPLLKELKQDDFPACVRQALLQPGPVKIDDPSSTCADCPITEKYSDKGRMTIRLDHAEKVYGVLSVSFGVNIIIDEEELSLFEEIAKDIAFAFSNIELEEKKEQTVKELETNEEFVSDVFNAIQAGISVLNTELTITGTNKWMEEMYSDKMPLTGKKCYQAYQGRKSICPWCPSKLTLEDGKQHFAMVPYPNEENTIGWLELSSYPLIDTNGKITGLIEHVKDITERVRVEQKLLESAEYQKAIFETTTLATAIIGEDTTLTMVNKEFEKLSGYSKEELEGKKSWTEFVAEEDLKRMKELHQQRRIDPDDALKQYDFQFINREGNARNIHLHVDLIPGTNNSVASLLDITEQVQAQQEMETLLALSRQAGTEANLEDMLFFITRRLVEVIPPAETASIFFYDEERDVIKIQAWAGFTDSEIKGLEFSIEDSQVGRILHTKKPTLINDVSESHDFKPIDKPSLLRVKSQIAVPLLIRKRVIGIMFADNLTRTNAFSQKNLDLLESIGNQLAGVIKNARLHDQVLGKHKQLSQSEKNFRDLVANSPYGIIIADKLGKHLFVNKEASQITGYSPEELLNLSIEEITPPEELAKLKKGYLDRVVGKPVPDQYERPMVRKNGTTILTELNTTVTMWEGNKCGMAIIRDVTERKERQKTIQQEKDKAQKYLDVAGVIILVLNKKGEITLINQKGNQILGYDEKELIGKNWADTCVPERLRKELKRVFRKIIAGDIETVRFYENPVLTRSGGERIIAWHNTLLWDKKGRSTGVLSSGEDITKRVRAEKLLTALNQAAVSMGAAQTQQEIFNAIAEELKQLDISCILFPLDDSQGELITEYLSYESALLNAAEKLVGIKHEDFSFPTDAVDMYREVVKEKKTLFIDNSERAMRQIIPELTKKLTAQIIKLLHIKKSVSAPLMVKDQVIGVFSVQSDNLIREDIPAFTAFAHELAGAWNRTKLVQDLRKTVEGTIYTIAATVEARDPYTAGHQTRVADLAGFIASEMGLAINQVEGIKMAGVIHDLGKVQVPAEILSKPGKISELEYEIIKTHPRVGFNLLKNIEFPWPIAEMILQHHEMIDGSGYPQGLKGDEIMLEARILAVADTVEAMSSHRPYRPALGIEKALDHIKQNKGTLFDPGVVDACKKVFEDGYKLADH